jgi:CheY-like chemotaxis protein
MTEGTKKSTVLLVEDDSDQRRRIKGELENAGLTVTEAAVRYSGL